MPSRPSMKCEDGKSEAQTLMFPSRSTYHTITSTTSAFPYLLPHLSIPPLLNTTSTRTFSTVINSASMTKSNIPSTTLQPQTILFIHGALSSHQEYRFVSHSRHLQGYHILIPSLHSSGPDTSLGVRPFTLERVATLLAHLVHTQSPDGRAHIVGVSLGAHVAVALASLFPDVLQDGSMFVSGYNRFETPAMLRPIVPYFFYALMKGPILLPKRLVRWAMDGADVKGVDARTGNEVTVEEREVGGVCNLDLVEEIVGPVFGKSDDFLPVLGLDGRICIVVATKGGWLIPSDDNIPHAKILLQKVCGQGGKNSAGKLLVQHKAMRHPWDLQAPDLFAESVVSFIEERGLDAGFVEC